MIRLLTNFQDMSYTISNLYKFLKGIYTNLNFNVFFWVDYLQLTLNPTYLKEKKKKSLKTIFKLKSEFKFLK